MAQLLLQHGKVGLRSVAAAGAARRDTLAQAGFAGRAVQDRARCSQLGCERAEHDPFGAASDADGASEFDHLCEGIGQARRGRLEAPDVLNTRSLDALRPLLDATTGRRVPALQPAVQDAA